MKKIIISGCANCPYLRIWNNGEEKEINSIGRGECCHPSWNYQLINPLFPATVFLEYECENTDNERLDNSPVYNLRMGNTPKWCPLPNDTI